MNNSNVPQRPIEYSYWVVPGKILTGEYPRNKDDESSLKKIGALEKAGIEIILDLTESDEGLEPYSTMLHSATHHRFPITDVSTPKNHDDMKKILDTIDEHVAQERCVYIHCWGGVGRTGTVVGCWLARHKGGGEAGLKALRKLWLTCPKSAWRKSPETSEQENYILKWVSPTTQFYCLRRPNFLERKFGSKNFP